MNADHASKQFQELIGALQSDVALQRLDNANALFAELRQLAWPEWLVMDLEAVPKLLVRHRFDECSNVLLGIKSRFRRPKAWETKKDQSR